MNGFENNKPFLGLYEKALPENLDWEEKLSLARQAGYSFMELSIDGSEERLERLKWDKIKRRKYYLASRSSPTFLLKLNNSDSL